MPALMTFSHPPATLSPGRPTLIGFIVADVVEVPADHKLPVIDRRLHRP
jgi:hypothetical protein